MCDDVEAEVAALRAKGVEAAPITDQGWGLLTSLTLPGGGAIGRTGAVWRGRVNARGGAGV